MKVLDFLNSRKAKIVILVVLVLCIYSQSLLNEYAYDDGGLLLKVEAIHGLSLEHIRLVFTSVPNNMEFLPVRDLTYMIDYTIWGNRAFGYHLSNMLFYIVLILLLYILLNELSVQWDMRETWFPFLATVLFAAHPLHVEVVASISHRKDLVMGIFYLLSIFLFLRFRRNEKRGFYYASLGAACLALLSKGTAVSLPIAVMFTGWTLDVRRVKGIWHNIFQAVPFFIVAGIITVVNFKIIRNAGFLSPPIFGGIAESLSLSAISIFAYIKMMIWPYPLTVWHSIDFFVSITSARALTAFAGILILFALIIMRKKWPLVSFSVGWYLITLAPVLSVASANYLLFERYLLLPSISFCALVAFVLLRTLKGGSKMLKAISLTSGAGIITAYIILTIVQVPVWKDNITLWSHAFKHNPYKTEIYTKLAKQFFVVKRYDEAFQILERAREINPVLPDADFYPAVYDYQQGDFDAALAKLNKMQSRFGMAYVDIFCLYGQIFEQQGNIDKAFSAYKKALSSDITLYSAYCSKGEVSRALKALAE